MFLNKDILQSVNEHRIHHQLYPNEILFEDGFDQSILDRLKANGHHVVNFGHGGSTVQAVERLNNGNLQAVCDSRKGGQPSGF